MALRTPPDFGTAPAPHADAASASSNAPPGHTDVAFPSTIEPSPMRPRRRAMFIGTMYNAAGASRARNARSSSSYRSSQTSWKRP